MLFLMAIVLHSRTFIGCISLFASFVQEVHNGIQIESITSDMQLLKEVFVALHFSHLGKKECEFHELIEN